MRLLECYVTCPNLSRKGVGKTGTERNEFGIPFLLREKERDKFPLTNLEYNKQDKVRILHAGIRLLQIIEIRNLLNLG